MKAQDYILTELEKLRQPFRPSPSGSGGVLQDEIVRLILSKKFRKYAANSDLVSHIKQAVSLNMAANQPINFTFLHGAYKLWRLDESPEADWAELFALMYYIKWLKPVCELYTPGVWFDFFVDDSILEVLNNLERAEIDAYMCSYQVVINFLKEYRPKNFHMTITPVSRQFDSEEALWQSFEKQLRIVQADGLPKLSHEQRATIELNVRLDSKQGGDAYWREKVAQKLKAYMVTKSEAGYHKNRPDKILVFTQPLPSGTALAVGTTKDSVMKFWMGVGVLRPEGETFKMSIRSQGQLASQAFRREAVAITGLDQRNFANIRILQ